MEPVQSVDSQIIGGVDAVPGEIPSMLSLQVNGFHHCGAILIEPDYGLTSAKCVLNQQVFRDFDQTRLLKPSILGPFYRVFNSNSM